MDILSSDSGERAPSERGSSQTFFAACSHDPERIVVLDVNSDSEASVPVPSVIDEADVFFSISDTEAEVTLGERMQEESQPTREDFIDFFSRPRLIPRIVTLHLCMIASMSVDILTGFDLLLSQKRQEIMAYLRAKMPRSVMLSPPCTMFSQLMNTNWARMDAAVVKQRWKEAMALLKFSLEVAYFMMSIGGIFILEHPTGPSSWRLPEMQALINHPDTFLVTFHQCRFGLRAPLSGFPIRKSTRLLTNSSYVAARFDHVFCKCQGPHKTIQGNEGPYKLSKYCEQYPEELCDALLLAIQQHFDSQAHPA